MLFELENPKWMREEIRKKNLQRSLQKIGEEKSGAQ